MTDKETVNRREFPTYEELVAFVNPMISENCWAIDIRHNPTTGAYSASWIEHKKYQTQDGQTLPDEIWSSEAGEIKCVQDLDLEQAQTALRALLRQERESQAMMRGTDGTGTRGRSS